MRKVLKIFENFSQPAVPVKKPDQPVHWLSFPKQLLGLCIELDEPVPDY